MIRADLFRVDYDRRLKLATFVGPVGFTQVTMTELQAEAIARIYSLPFTARDGEL